MIGRGASLPCHDEFVRRDAVVAGLIVAVAYGVFAFRLLGIRGGDVSRFVLAGGSGVDADKVPPGLTVIPNIGGYDGIAFYRLAVDPFTTETVKGIQYAFFPTAGAASITPKNR